MHEKFQVMPWGNKSQQNISLQVSMDFFNCTGRDDCLAWMVSEFSWDVIICANIARTRSLLCHGDALTLKWISLKCDDNSAPAWRTDLSWLHRDEHWRDGFSFRSMRTSTRLLANQQNVLRDFPYLPLSYYSAKEAWNATRVLSVSVTLSCLHLLDWICVCTFKCS